jgi:hypothetical protein
VVSAIPTALTAVPTLFNIRLQYLDNTQLEAYQSINVICPKMSSNFGAYDHIQSLKDLNFAPPNLPQRRWYYKSDAYYENTKVKVHTTQVETYPNNTIIAAQVF